MHNSSMDDGGVTAKPLVSVIIPTRNRAHCLPGALDSVYAQEGLGKGFDLEVIVVDDASSDSTSEVIRRYQGARYIRLQQRRGVSAAKNEALRAGRGSYVAFLDDDDVWLPHKLRVQVSLLTAHPDVGVVYGQSLVRRVGATEWLYPDVTYAPSGWVFTAMLMDNFCGAHAILLARRTAFDKAGYFDESLASYEDYDMSLRLALHSAFLFAPGAVHIYNLSPHGSWLTRAASGATAEDLARVKEKALQMLPEPALTKAWAQVMTTLRTCPETLRDERTRGNVSRTASWRALKAASPVSEARELCAQIKTAIPRRGTSVRWWTRLTVARIWVELARSLTFSTRARARRDAAYAAICAVAQAPTYLFQTGLLRVILRSALGRGADAFLMKVYRRVKPAA